MAAHPLTEDQHRETLGALAKYGSQAEAARALGVNFNTFRSRVLIARSLAAGTPARVSDIPERQFINIDSGVVLVFSDAHYHPGHVSTAHRALVKAIKEFRPRGLVANGDIIDGASISRHPPIGGEQRPTVKQELKAASERLGELEAAAGSYAWKVWNQGNHDARFAAFLAANAPQYEGVPGFALKDHFPAWQHGMRLDINPGEDSHTIIKHRWKGGVHAAHNNAKESGVNFVTGHLHALTVREWNNARGAYFGVDCGTLADIHGPHAPYIEDGLTQWRSGFVVLTYRSGRLLAPEVVRVVAEGVVEFRGREHRV